MTGLLEKSQDMGRALTLYPPDTLGEDLAYINIELISCLLKTSFNDRIHQLLEHLRWASAYDFLTNLLTFGQTRRLREMTIDVSLLKPGESLLDVGCGTGGVTIPGKRLVLTLLLR